MRDQLWLQTFSEYTRRYAEVVRDLPSDSRRPNSSFDINTLPVPSETACSTQRGRTSISRREEFFLHRRGRIDDETWSIWRTGIEQTVRLPWLRGASADLDPSTSTFRSSAPCESVPRRRRSVTEMSTPWHPTALRSARFAGAVLVGGSNFVAIRYSNRELDPLWGAGLRFGLAAAVFAVLVVVLRLSLPRGRVLGLVVLYGLLAFAIAYGCLYWALQDVPAGIGAVVMAVGPLLTLLLAVAHRMERLSGRAVAGAVIALGGSALIFFQSGSVDFGWHSFVLLIVAALAAAESVVISKRCGPLSPMVMNFVGMTAGAGALLVVSAAAGETLALPEAGKTQIALVYLVAATVALFLMVLVVVQRWAASSTSYIFVLMPVVAVALGALVADERDHGDDDRRRSDCLRGGLSGCARAARIGLLTMASLDRRNSRHGIGLKKKLRTSRSAARAAHDRVAKHDAPALRSGRYGTPSATRASVRPLP